MKQFSQEIIGKTVVNTSGFVIGEVNDYVVDLETWQVSDLQLKIERKKAKELNLKVSFFKLGSLLVLVDVHQVDPINDQVILSLSKEDFKGYIDARQEDDEEEEAPQEEEEEK